MPGKGSQAAVARLEHEPSKCSSFLFLGRRHWRTRSCGHQRQEPRNGDRGTRHSAAGCPFLHREHTTKLGNVHLCVLESSSSEMALVDGPLCQDGVQTLRGCGADRQHCQPRFPSLPSLVLQIHAQQGRHPHPQDNAGPASTTRTRGRKARTPFPSPSTLRHLSTPLDT